MRLARNFSQISGARATHSLSGTANDRMLPTMRTMRIRTTIAAETPGEMPRRSRLSATGPNISPTITASATGSSSPRPIIRAAISDDARDEDDPDAGDSAEEKLEFLCAHLNGQPFRAR